MKLNLYKLYGGKFYHAKWVIEHFPAGYEQMTYIEPYAGALNVLLQKKPSVKEIANDFNRPTHCVHLAAQNGDLAKAVKYIPYIKEVFDYYVGFKPTTQLDHAVQQYVLHRMSRGGMKKNFAWSERLRGGIPGDVNAWHNAIKNLPLIQKRVNNVIFTCDDGEAFIRRSVDSPDVFWYLDPPYLADTRTSKSVYDLEFTEQQHIDLLDLLLTRKSKWLLSGYESKLYNDKLGPPIARKEVVLSAGQGKKKNKKTEVLWSNY